MKKLVNLLATATLLAGLVLTVPAVPALADCPDGTTGPDTINCTTDPVPGTDNGDTQVDGDQGDDVITVSSDATVSDVDGDGAATAVNDSSDNPSEGDGGNDTITINGTVTDSVYGDFAYDGAGGNDTIVVNGSVQNGVNGDDVSTSTADGVESVGGDDNIVVNNGAYVGSINGDGNYASEAGSATFTDGADNIQVDGYVDGVVAGDGNYGEVGECNECGITAYGGNDTIHIGTNGDVGPVMGEGSNYYAACEGACGIEASGGNDSIVVDGAAYGDKENPAVAGDGIYASTECLGECFNTVTGGNDAIVVNTIAFGDVVGDGIGNYVDCEIDCGANSYGGNDQITVNGAVLGYVSGDGIVTDDYAQGGNDTITVNGFSGVIAGDDISAYSGYGGNDTITVGPDGLAYDVVGDGIDASYGAGGNDTIVINGSAYYVAGDGVGTSVILPLQGVQSCAQGCVDNVVDGGNDTIVINGIAGYVLGDDATGCAGDDNITVNGTVVFDVYGDYADNNCGVGLIKQAPGNDTITVGAGGVSYSTVCQDIEVTNLDAQQGAVGGTIYGDSGYGNVGYDTLVFNVLGDGGGVASYLAGSDQNDGSVTVNGQTYSYAEMDNLTVHSIAYHEGATRMYDDGVTLAFSAPDGIQVCNGPSGMKAGLIDYGRLHDGQLEYGANGFTVKLVPVGSNHFEVHVYDSNGTEQIDDANNDGTADSLFVFGF